MIKIPPYLKKGDTIGITCPAGYMAREKAQACIETLQQWGFQVMVGKTLGSNSANYFSGTDEERLNELQAMMDNEEINAILFGRGGYGVGRIIERINFNQFKKKPKWLIGYSDITVLHSHIHSNYKIATLHSPMAAAFNDSACPPARAGSDGDDPVGRENKNEFIASLHKAIIGRKAKYKCDVHPFNKQGIAAGELVGGNLSLLAHLVGTSSDIHTANKILFIEDIGELIYSTDRLLYQLLRSGKLDKLAGLIIGKFTDVKDTDRPFGKSIDEVISDIIKPFSYPVCFNFPLGHVKENYALKIGGKYQLEITGKRVSLSEL
jgi:muramoyltetrapeptide carboxypeptidase